MLGWFACVCCCAEYVCHIFDWLVYGNFCLLHSKCKWRIEFYGFICASFSQRIGQFKHSVTTNLPATIHSYQHIVVQYHRPYGFFWCCCRFDQNFLACDIISQQLQPKHTTNLLVFKSVLFASIVAKILFTLNPRLNSGDKCSSTFIRDAGNKLYDVTIKNKYFASLILICTPKTTIAHSKWELFIWYVVYDQNKFLRSW